MLRAILVAMAVWAWTPAAIAQDIPPTSTMVPGAAQGGTGDLWYLPAGTIEGVHVIQGGRVQCVDPVDVPPGCAASGIRSLSLNLDIGAGSAHHRGDLGFNYDVGKSIKLFDGHSHRGIVVTYDRQHDRPRIGIWGTVVVHGSLRVLHQRKDHT